jgi:hypothetical protein
MKAESQVIRHASRPLATSQTFTSFPFQVKVATQRPSGLIRRWVKPSWGPSRATSDAVDDDGLIVGRVPDRQVASAAIPVAPAREKPPGGSRGSGRTDPQPTAGPVRDGRHRPERARQEMSTVRAKLNAAGDRQVRR